MSWDEFVSRYKIDDVRKFIEKLAGDKIEMNDPVVQIRQKFYAILGNGYCHCHHMGYCTDIKKQCEGCGMFSSVQRSLNAKYGKCLCSQCNEKVRLEKNKELWDFWEPLIKLEKIKCVQCERDLGPENIRRDSENELEFDCPECKLTFKLHFGHVEDILDENGGLIVN